MYPGQLGSVRVPVNTDAHAITVGADLVATIGQFGIYSYTLLRAAINGPVGEFRLYKGSLSTPYFSSVFSAGVADAQFTPGEVIPQGNNLYGVWINGAGYAGNAYMVITTDGGIG